MTFKTVTETAATATILGRTLIEEPNGGGVFPNYSVTCSYDSTTFEVDDQNNKIHVIAGGVDPHTFVLTPEELYPFYLIPVVAQVNGQSVTTVLGELLCSQVDNIIQNRKLREIIQANPTSQTVSSGDVVSLTVRVNHIALAYVNYSIAWYQDGVPLSDFTEEIFMAVTETTSFQAKVTTPFGVAESDIAHITVE